MNAGMSKCCCCSISSTHHSTNRIHFASFALLLSLFTFVPSMHLNTKPETKRKLDKRTRNAFNHILVQAENVFLFLKMKREKIIEQSKTKQLKRIRRWRRRWRRWNGNDNKKIDALTQLLCKSGTNCASNHLPLHTHKRQQQNKKHSSVQHVNFDTSPSASYFEEEEKKTIRYVQHQTTYGTEISVSVARLYLDTSATRLAPNFCVIITMLTTIPFSMQVISTSFNTTITAANQQHICSHMSSCNLRTYPCFCLPDIDIRFLRLST